MIVTPEAEFEMSTPLPTTSIHHVSFLVKDAAKTEAFYRELLGFVLLERTDDTSVGNLTASQIYTGTLNNTGETLTLTYTVRATDSNADSNTLAAYHERTVIVTITGTNDAPVIAVGSSNSASSGLTETNSTLTAGGTLSVEDLDYSNTVTASVQSVVASGTTAGILSNNAALQSMLSVTTGNVISGWLV